MTDTGEEKKKLRALLREERSGFASANPEAASSLRDVFFSGVRLPDYAVVSSYIAQDGEMDPAPLEAALAVRGHALCLPCIEEKKSALLFRAYADGDPLHLGFWNIPEPLSTRPIIEPSVLLLPLLGFDRAGTRLGQGGGYYDRTLAALRSKRKILAIGLAFAVQERASLPFMAHDQKLDLIVTEKEIIDPAS